MPGTEKVIAFSQLAVKGLNSFFISQMFQKGNGFNFFFILGQLFEVVQFLI
jgi:hypothetical protein